MVHIRKDIKEHCILKLLVCLHKSFNSEHEELIVGYVGVTVEELAFSSYAHGVQSETKLTEKLFREEGFRALFISLVFAFDHCVKVFHHGIIFRFEFVKVGVIGNAELHVQSCEKYLEGIDLRRIEILIDSEEVL